MIKAGFFRLFRFSNLLMVILTMYLMRWSVIKPILEVQNLNLQVSELAFLILLLSTVLITAAGYVINDYHDAKADRINRPDQVIIDRIISRRQALLMHWILNIAGVVAGSAFAIKYNLLWLVIPFAGAPFLLWYYSFALKHRIILGNLLVSLLTASVPLLVLFFELPLLIRNYGKIYPFLPDLLRVLVFWIGTFAFFAFMTNFIREIIKDAEDMKGDGESGSRTVPLSLGLRTAKTAVVSLSAVTLAVLGFVFIHYLTDWISMGFYFLFLFLPFVLLMIKMIKAINQVDFRFLSQLIRLIMLFGLLYAPVANWLISKFFRI